MADSCAHRRKGSSRSILDDVQHALHSRSQVGYQCVVTGNVIGTTVRIRRAHDHGIKACCRWRKRAQLHFDHLATLQCWISIVGNGRLSNTADRPCHLHRCQWCGAPVHHHGFDGHRLSGIERTYRLR